MLDGLFAVVLPFANYWAVTIARLHVVLSSVQIDFLFSFGGDTSPQTPAPSPSPLRTQGIWRVFPEARIFKDLVFNLEPRVDIVCFRAYPMYILT